jgi:hypothetical protein
LQLWHRYLRSKHRRLDDCEQRRFVGFRLRRQLGRGWHGWIVKLGSGRQQRSEWGIQPYRHWRDNSWWIGFGRGRRGSDRRQLAD